MNAWTVISQEGMRHNPITDSTQTDTPCHPGDLRPHDPISGMSPKDRLAKAISIPDSFPGWVGPRDITHKYSFP